MKIRNLYSFLSHKYLQNSQERNEEVAIEVCLEVDTHENFNYTFASSFSLNV